MGDRFVDNVVILSTVLLRITNLYCVLFNNEHKAAEDKPTQWWSVAAKFSVDNDLSLKFCGKHNGDFVFLLQSCGGLRLIVLLVVVLGCSKFLSVIGVNSYVEFNTFCCKYVDLY